MTWDAFEGSADMVKYINTGSIDKIWSSFQSYKPWNAYIQ